MANAMQIRDALPKDPAELMQLLKRAEAGDTKTLPVVRKLLESPEMVEMCGGDLARQTECHLIQAAAGKNLSFKEALLRKTKLLREQLAGPSPTPLERLLVERIVTCWLLLHDTEIRFVQAKDMTIQQADYRQRAIDRCHLRYLSALKALAVVRRLALPVLLAQVNIANQTNVTRGSGPSNRPPAA